MLNVFNVFNKKNTKGHRRQTLKNRIHKYISRKQDICCENDINRKIVIQQIFEKYKTICGNLNEPDEYLNYINNDIVKFIGYNVDLKKNKDFEGIKLWNEMDKRMFENKIVNEAKVEILLQNVPLYFLLSFLGYASYYEKTSTPL
jgi:hypothetical protein